MASLKFFTFSDIHESQRCNLLGKFDQNSVSCSNGYFQISGACSINPFTRQLKHIRVSRLSNDVVEVSEPNEEGSDVKNDLVLQNPVHENGVKKNPRSIWRRFGRKPKLGTSGKQKQGTPLVSSGEASVELDDVVAGIRPDSSVERCNMVLKQLENRGDDVKTMRFFELMRSNGKLKDNLVAYNFALRVLGRKEDWKAAEMLLQEVIDNFGSQLSFQVFNTLIFACHKRGLWELGTKWFLMMLENGVRPNVATFGMLMRLYQKSGSVKEAEFAFDRMRSFKVQCESGYSAMITMYCRLGLYGKAEEIIGFMKEDEVAPDMENWLVQLNAYSQQGKLEEADRVLASMREAGFPPNIVAYNTLITGYGKISDMVAAEYLFQNLQNLGLEPDETTYRSMVEGWGRADNHQEAKRYYHKLKQVGFKPNSSNVYSMLNLQAKNDDDEGVVEILEDMRKIGCQYPSILSNLIRVYEKLGKVERVPLVIKGNLYEHVLVDQTSCSILVMAYVKHHLVEDALQVLDEKQWESSAFKDNLYHLLICSCKDSGHHEEAVKIFVHMPKSDAKPNLHITCTMIDLYASMGRFAEAKDLYVKLKSSEVTLDMVAYSIIVRMYVKARSLKDACDILDRMEKQKDVIPDTFLYRDMLRIYQLCGLQEKLEDLYYRILKSGITWDQEMYNCIINCCARAVPVDELTRVFNEMLDRGFAPNTITFNVMLDVYGKAKLFKKAWKVFDLAQKRGLVDVISYNTIVAAYGQNKDLKKMQSTVRKMEFNGFSVSLEAYNCMLDAYGKEGDMETFGSVLDRMKESNCASDHYTYGIMINIYGEQGWIEDVAEVLTELKEHGIGPNLCSYNSLIKAYGIAGMDGEAVAVVKEMRENGIEPDRITYINLIRALQRNDNFLEAVKWSLWMKQMGMAAVAF